MTLKRVLECAALDQSNRSYLRLVTQSDATYICDLRGDRDLNKYLSPASTNVGDQRNWIAQYKNREASGDEFYFVIVSDGADVGVIRLYDFQKDVNSFCWGSWIVQPQRPAGLVTYSFYCALEIGFDVLGFDQTHFDVRRQNDKAFAFYQRAGAIITRSTNIDHFLNLDAVAWTDFKKRSQPQVQHHRTANTVDG